MDASQTVTTFLMAGSTKALNTYETGLRMSTWAFAIGAFSVVFPILHRIDPLEPP